MSGRREEEATWDGGPPGAEREQGPQPLGPAAPPMYPDRGNVKMAYPSYSQYPPASNTPYMNSGDDFLYATPKQSDYFPGPPMNYAHDGKPENDSCLRSRRSPHHSERYSDSRRSRRKYRKSQSKSPKRRFKKARSRSLSKGKSSGRYERNSKSFDERRSYDRSPSHRGRKFKKRSSSSSSSCERSKSKSRSLTDEKDSKKKHNKDNKSKSVPEKDKFNISKRSRSQSTETSSSSNSSSMSERYYSKYDYRTKGKGNNRRETHSKMDKSQLTKTSSPEFSQQISYQSRDTPEKFSRGYKNVNGTPFVGSSHILQPQAYQPKVEKFNYQLPAAAQFRNDGSFLEMFKKIQESQKAQENTASTSTGPDASKTDIKKPTLPLVGKRRGGRVLKTGVVKKPKSIEEQTVDSAPTDAWSLYLKEVKKYKDSSCDEECKMRPLFK